MAKQDQNKSKLPLAEARLVGARGAAALCGISPSTWWRLDVSGKIPLAIKLRGRCLWRVKELDAWIEAGCPTREKWILMKEQGAKQIKKGGK